MQWTIFELAFLPTFKLSVLLVLYIDNTKNIFCIIVDGNTFLQSFCIVVMATPPYNIVSELLERVQELSNAVATPSQTSNRTRQSSTSSTNQNSIIEEEVSYIFNRPSSQTQNSNIRQPNQNTTPRPPRNSAPLYHLRRNYQDTCRSRGSKPKKCKQASGPFLRDVVLLTGPEDTFVPRQGIYIRIWLWEHGHILNGFEFYKEWNECQVELAIKEALGEALRKHEPQCPSAWIRPSKHANH